MASSERAARSDSLIEEVKGLKGHRLGMPKMMFRQLATERFTEPHEAIVTRFRKRTPTQGGLLLGILEFAKRCLHWLAYFGIPLLPVAGDCGRVAWLLTPPCRKGVFLQDRNGVSGRFLRSVVLAMAEPSPLEQTLRQPQPKLAMVLY